MKLPNGLTRFGNAVDGRLRPDFGYVHHGGALFHHVLDFDQQSARPGSSSRLSALIHRCKSHPVEIGGRFRVAQRKARRLAVDAGADQIRHAALALGPANEGQVGRAHRSSAAAALAAGYRSVVVVKVLTVPRRPISSIQQGDGARFRPDAFLLLPLEEFFGKLAREPLVE